MNQASFRRTAMVSMAGCVSLMSLLVLPLMVGSYVDDIGLSEKTAGWLASVTFLGSALAALVLAFRIHHLRLRVLARSGLLIMVLMDGLSIFATSLPLEALFLLRFIAGIANACAYGAVMSGFACWRQPERAYGFFMAMQFLVSALGLYALPLVLPQLGVAGFFGLFLLLDLLALALVSQLPDTAERSNRADLQTVEWKLILTVTALVCLCAIGLFETANMAQFTYVERLGSSLELEPRQIGTALGIATLIGIPAAFLVSVLGNRFGYFRPILFACSLEIVALVWLIRADDFTSYLLAMSMVSFGWAMGLPYFHAIEAGLDRGGSVVVAGGFATSVGGFIGPAGAAMLVSPGNYEILLQGVIGTLVLVVLLTGIVTYRLRS